MSTISARLQEDMKDAMRSKDKLRKGVIDLIRAALKNAEIKKRGDLAAKGVQGEDLIAQSALTADEELALVKLELNQTKDVLAEVVKAGRLDRVPEEEAKIEVIMQYMPKQLTREEILGLALTLGIKKGDKDGPSVGKIMKAANGSANSDIVKEVVATILA